MIILTWSSLLFEVFWCKDIYKLPAVDCGAGCIMPKKMNKHMISRLDDLVTGKFDPVGAAGFFYALLVCKNLSHR